MSRQPTGPSHTFQRLSEQVLGSIRAGASAADAARRAGCAPRTVERWVARGRSAPSGPYGAFASELDAARADRELDVSGTPEITPAELEELVAKAIRAGSVQAMRLWWQMHRADKPANEAERDPLAALDELAQRRTARGKS